MGNNPRRQNGNLRDKHRQRLKAMGLPCHICGREIDYSLPYLDPGAFVIDEIKPISKWKQFGYSSAREAAEDWNNLAPAHRRCNALKGAKIGFQLDKSKRAKKVPTDGAW